MPSSALLQLLGITLAVIVMIWAIAARRKSHGKWLVDTSEKQVCDHLRPAFELLRSRGHQVRWIGRNAVELPVEIHMIPEFDPQALYDELKLAEPVFVSERNVLYCKEDWCEIHPQTS